MNRRKLTLKEPWRGRACNFPEAIPKGGHGCYMDLVLEAIPQGGQGTGLRDRGNGHYDCPPMVIGPQTATLKRRRAWVPEVGVNGTCRRIMGARVLTSLRRLQHLDPVLGRTAGRYKLVAGR